MILINKILIAIGALLVVFGIVDFAGARVAQFDVLQEMGISLPELLWKYSAYIEMGLGALLFSIGRSSEEEEEESAQG